jgi:hypothetical protein
MITLSIPGWVGYVAGGVIIVILIVIFAVREHKATQRRDRAEILRQRHRVQQLIEAGKLFPFKADCDGDLICPLCERWVKRRKVFESDDSDHFRWYGHCGRETCGYEFVMKTRIETEQQRHPGKY